MTGTKIKYANADVRQVVMAAMAVMAAEEKMDLLGRLDGMGARDRKDATVILALWA